ncbi:hypothetical protein SAMN04488515_3158 [Cognatiyoonia koreensis]|uniref:Ankyrin repeat-containing protein n=2 Tax=Cognatiyoonia koreensis TaxID=364200 RepID=A0A1I0RS75_9RHOB|nr:hypothetical protein SAMN04488515_3158 [Cognatiyoonia koreensis]
MAETAQNITKCFDSAADAQARAANIGASADEETRAVLTNLYLNAEPDVEALRGLGKDRLDQVLRTADDKFNHTTLLNEAVRQANYRWTKALLDAGADPNASGSLMAYTASDNIWHPKTSPLHLFQDGSPAVPFLELYLDYGGALDTTGGGGYNNNPLINAPFKNLAAQVFLLERSANGWLTSLPESSRAFRRTMFGKYITGGLSADYNETMYTFVIRDLFRMPQSDSYRTMVHDVYLDLLERESDSSGPEARHHLWTLQRVVGAMIDKGHITPSARMTELLTTHAVPDSEGGWVTPKGQLHQNYDDPRQGSVLGTELW